MDDPQPGTPPPAAVPVEVEPIDPEDAQVVPAALTAFVEAGRHTVTAISASSRNPALLAAEALTDVVAATAAIAAVVAPYLGDLSPKGASAMGRAERLLVGVRAELHAASRQLALDDSGTTATPA